MTDKKAFSLVEIIVSIVLITITAICTLEFLRYATQAVKKNDMRAEATYFAIETMEKQYLNSQVVPQANVQDALPTAGGVGTSGELHNTYSGSRSYNVTAGRNGAPYGVLKVTVAWNQ